MNDQSSFEVFLEVSSNINTDTAARKKFFDKTKLDVSHTGHSQKSCRITETQRSQ